MNVSLTDKIGENDNFTLTIYQKNLPSNSIVDFKIVKLGEETTSNKNINAYSPRRQIYLDKQVLTFELNEYYYFNEAVGPYVFELLVNGKVVDSIPIVRSGTASYINESYSSIKLHANNGTDYYETVSVKNETFHSFDNEDINNENFFNDYHYIVSWNTKADGTGVSYSVDKKLLIMKDMDLYAQWKAEKYTLTFDANGGNGTMAQQSFTYDVFQNISSVLFNKEGYVFDSWNTKADGTGISYSNGQSISLKDNLTLYAQWSVENPVVVNKYNYDKDSNYIADIDVETSLDSYMQNIKLGSGYRMDVGFKNINNNKYLYTGSRTRIYKNNVLYKELINVVSGDTNGDGKINYLDYVNVYNHIQKIKHPESTKKVLTGEYLAAADMARDSKINYLDYVKIYKKIKELKGGN